MFVLVQASSQRVTSFGTDVNQGSWALQNLLNLQLESPYVRAANGSTSSSFLSGTSQSSSLSWKSSLGSEAPLNAVTRCRIHCISNSLQSGRGSSTGSLVSRQISSPERIFSSVWTFHSPTHELLIRLNLLKLGAYVGDRLENTYSAVVRKTSLLDVFCHSKFPSARGQKRLSYGIYAHVGKDT